VGKPAGREMALEGVERIQLAQDRVYWRTQELNFWVPSETGSFFTS
jgi:hypothetical protein